MHIRIIWDTSFSSECLKLTTRKCKHYTDKYKYNIIIFNDEVCEYTSTPVT
jgi:hypothetical protein